VAYFQVLFKHFPGNTEESHEEHQDLSCFGRDSNGVLF
jgi:hypothetical protein